MSDLTIYRNYDGSVFSLDGTDGEGVSWRNIHGFPLDYVSVLTPEAFTSVLSPSERYMLGPAGVYTLTVCDDEYDNFRSVFDEIYNSYSVLSPLYESVLNATWTNEAISAANLSSPLYVSVYSRNRYNKLGASLDRLQIAINIWESTINDQIIPGMGLIFNQGLFKRNKAEITIGGGYISAEDRTRLDVIFGTIPVNAQSSSVPIVIRNDSGGTLINLTAKVVNRFAVAHSTNPFLLTDQDYNLTPDVTSAFESALIDIRDISGGTARIKADDTYYDMIEDTTSALIEAPSAINADGSTAYVFGDGAPVEGLKFVLPSDVTESDAPTVYKNNGDEVFQLSLDDSTWSSAEQDVVSVLESAATSTIYVRSAPSSSIVSSDEYGTEGLLLVRADYLTETGPLSVLTDTLDASGSLMVHAAIRLVIPALGYKAHKIRFKFKTIGYRLKITQAWFGRRSGSTSNFQTALEIEQILFNAIETYEATTNTEQWTDWLEYQVNGADDHILAYHGPLIGWEGTESDRTAYYLSQGENSSSYNVEGFTLSSCHYDVTEVQVMTRDNVVASVPLICTVPKNISGTTLNAYMINADIQSALDDMGITTGSCL